jgi:hypothetical protein
MEYKIRFHPNKNKSAYNNMVKSSGSASITVTKITFQMYFHSPTPTDLTKFVEDQSTEKSGTKPDGGDKVVRKI